MPLRIHPRSLPEGTWWLHELYYLLGDLCWFQGAWRFSVIEGGTGDGWGDVPADVAVGALRWSGFVCGVLVCANVPSDDESEEIQEVFLEAIKVSAKIHDRLVQFIIVKYFLIQILKQDDAWQQGASTCVEGFFLLLLAWRVFWFYVDGVVALSAVSGADEATAEGHLSILWAGGCYGSGCSHVGLWIFPRVRQFVGWLIFVIILQKLVSAEVEWKYRLSLDSCTYTNSLSRFGHIMQALFLGFFYRLKQRYISEKLIVLRTKHLVYVHKRTFECSKENFADEKHWVIEQCFIK